MNFNEKKELQKLPDQIEKLESKIATIHGEMGEPGFYQQPKDEITKVADELNALEAELKTSYARWEELESVESASA